VLTPPLSVTSLDFTSSKGREMSAPRRNLLRFELFFEGGGFTRAREAPAGRLLAANAISTYPTNSQLLPDGPLSIR
jgi:hypothetical protein